MKIYSMKQIYNFNGHHLIEIKQDQSLEKRALFTQCQIELLVSREFARISFEKYNQLKKLQKNFLFKLGFSRYIKKYQDIKNKEIMIDSCIDISDTIKEAHLYKDKIFCDL